MAAHGDVVIAIVIAFEHGEMDGGRDHESTRRSAQLERRGTIVS
jgi:hypothetical protein